MFKLLKNVFNKLLNYAKKYPIRMAISAFIVYMCCSENLLARLKDFLGINDKILEPKGNDAQEQKQSSPEMDDVSMYKDSQLHTMKVADKSAELEDLVNEAHL